MSDTRDREWLDSFEDDPDEDEDARWCYVCGELPTEGDFGMCRACEAVSAEEMAKAALPSVEPPT